MKTFSSQRKRAHKMASDWFLQPLYNLGISSVVGVVFAFLKKKWPLFGSYFLYGLGVATCLFVSLEVIDISSSFPKTVEITPENIEEHLHQWLDNQRLSVQSLPDPRCFFRLNVISTGGRGFTIVRTKEDPQHLIISDSIRQPPNAQKSFDRIPADQLDELFYQINIEMALFNVGFRSSRQPLEIILNRKFTISNTLTEQLFADGFDTLDAATLVVQAMEERTFKRFPRNNTISSATR